MPLTSLFPVYSREHSDNCVANWCLKWKLSINRNQTKIVHFRPKRWRATDTTFYYNDYIIEKKVNEYKYLGKVIDEPITFRKCAEVLSESGGRVSGIIIAKFKNLKDCKYKTFTKLFHCGVIPIRGYSVGVWGSKEY